MLIGKHVVEKLYILVLLLPIAYQEYVVQQVCDFENEDTCGWQVKVESGEGEWEIALASTVPVPAPEMDFNPGTSSGKYFHFNVTGDILNSIEVLFFPSQKYLLNISFAFYLIGPLDLELLQVNWDTFELTSNSTWNENQPVNWKQTSVSFSNTVVGGVAIIIPSLELAAEADLENELGLGIDSLALAFHLPCNFDAIYSQELGSLELNSSVDFLNITLGNVSSLQLIANSSACPDGPFIFEIEGVSVPELEPIFTIDSLTGLVTINATGPYLLVGGTDGILTVSVHVRDSDYKQTGTLVKNKKVLQFLQGPTIVVQSLTTLSVEVNKPFSYVLVAQSSLSTNTKLQYNNLQTVPSSLVDFIALDENNITGVIPNSILSSIYSLTTTPSFSIDITDPYGGSLIYSVQILIKEAPPIFNSTHYMFMIDEKDTEEINDVVGSIYVLDPNGDTCLDLSLKILTTEQIIDNEFHLAHNYLSTSDIFCEFYVVVTTALDYEQRRNYTFTVQAADTTGYSSNSTVTVNVLPVNEYAPQFTLNSYQATITDVTPPDTEVVILSATDNDGGNDGSLSYSITGGNAQQYFAIHWSQSLSTMATIVVNISPIQPGPHILTVIVEDGGSPPMTNKAIVNITVLATTNVMCNAAGLGPPVLTGSAMNNGYKVFHTDVTLYCNFTSNPPAFPLQWIYQNINTLTTVTITSSSQYVLNENYLTILDALPSDNGLYQCNVTNLCGSKQEAYYILVLEYPYPPTGLTISISDLSSVFLSGLLTWTPSLYDVTTHPVDGYHLKLMEEGESDYSSISTVPFIKSGGTLVHETTINNLKPGTSYIMKMASYNIAGESESDFLNFTTANSPPRLKFLNARAMSNKTLLIEWALLYTGGSSNIQLTIVIQCGTAGYRKKRALDPIVVSFDPSITSQFLSPVLESALQYTISSDVSNDYGSNQEITYAFIGYEDSVYCGFSPGDSCQWEVQEDIVNASSLSSPLPTTDSTGNPVGYFVAGSVHVGDEQTPVLTYPAFSYICGFSFFFRVYDNTRLLLQTSNGTSLWASNTADMTEWEFVEYPSGQLSFIVTTEELVFVAEKMGVLSSFSYAAVDEVSLYFCLPCNLSTISPDSFSLSVPNYLTIHLREEEVIPIQAQVDNCQNAILHYSITSIVPNELAASFSIPDSKQGLIIVTPISTDIAEAGTTGILEVEVSIAQSDYTLSGFYAFTTANLYFSIDEKYTNCSFEDSCDFESGLCHWELIDTDSSAISTDADGNSFLSSTVSGKTLSHVIELWRTAVNDSYCGVSFLYQLESALLQVSVEGLGEVWSSDAVMTTNSLLQWESVTVYTDVKGVEHVDKRLLVFEMIAIGGTSGSVAIDNITLHPCINCEAKECSCVSCIQQCSKDPCQSGYYLSLEVNQCRACPQGHYCDDWNLLPAPCPPGTSNDQPGASSAADCKVCPLGMYTLQTGASACLTCPTGYDCPDPAALPNPKYNVVCDATSHCAQGEYLDLYSGLCQSCTPGFMCQEGARFPCPPGYYTITEMSTNCSLCPAGSFCSTPNQEPQACPDGSYSSSGQAMCFPCPVGSGSSQNGSSCVSLLPSTLTLVVTGFIGVVAGVMLTCLFGCLCCICCTYRKWRKKQRKKEHERHMYMDNFLLHTEKNLDKTGADGQRPYQSSSLRTTSTVLSFMNQYWGDSHATTHQNQAYVDSDSSDELEDSEQKKPVTVFPEDDPVCANAEMNALATGPSESDVSALIELDHKDDHVWDALKGKKEKKESKF